MGKSEAALIASQRKLINWAESKCPCRDETPDPCPLCGATVAAGACMAVESTIPPHLLREMRDALALATGAHP